MLFPFALPRSCAIAAFRAFFLSCRTRPHDKRPAFDKHRGACYTFAAVRGIGARGAEAAETAAVTYDYEVLEDGTANIYGYLADPVPDTLEIPAEIDGHKVTSIERLFTNEDEIRKVILPESLTVIGEKSFLFAASVEEIEIKGQVTRVGSKAFYGCDALKSLAFKEGLTELADTSIFLCKGLEELHLPASLTYTEDEFMYKIDYASPENLTIYTPAGSAAEAFAKAQGLNVVND